MGNDKNIGNFTYIGPQGCSVIDYVIMSADLFDITEIFDIDNRTESSHLPLVIMSKEHARPRVVEMTQLNDETSFFYSRKSTDIDTFVQEMSRFCQSEGIQSLYVDITNHNENIEDMTRPIIHAFQETAVKHERTVKPKEESPWFDKECKDKDKLNIKVVVIYTAAGTHPILKCLFTRQPFTMPKALYTRLPCIQYKIVIYTSAVYHVKRVIYTAAVHPV